MPKRRELSEKDLLSPRQRAEDILLGALGYGEGASLISIEVTSDGYRGRGEWEDGEQFDFESEDELSELERWACEILGSGKAGSDK